jgi:signal transduction histidine kinase
LPGLRQRLTAGVLIYVVLVSVVVATHGHLVNERAEQLVWESLLASELAHFAERRAADPSYRWTDTETLKLYGAPSARSIPEEFLGLSPGVHDELPRGASQFIALVSSIDGSDVVLALDISDMERDERGLALRMAAWTAVAVALLSLVTYLGTGWLTRSLSSMADSIASWSPERTGERLRVGRSAPREAKTIAAALNQYAERLEQFLERERAFINVASHELRTPIAVISGSAEVALDLDSTHRETQPYLQHVLTTARDMERLVSLLVALAKDPERLRAAAEPVDLADLLPHIVQDHKHLAASKELRLELSVAGRAAVKAPPQIIRAAIGNLVRNAIENSDRGTVTVTVSSDARVVVKDPGHGMSDAELSALYTRLARSGQLGDSGAGIGIELIMRLCEHLGWRLTFSSEPERGTTAILVLEPTPTEIGETTIFRHVAS